MTKITLVHSAPEVEDIPDILRRTASLDELAHEINVRLQKADDHRLSASLKLAEAKVACKAAGVSFKSWVAKEIKLSYVEANKLALIGAAPDPAEALADFRERARQRKVVFRNTTPDEPTLLTKPIIEVSSRPARGREAVASRACEAIVTLAGLPPAIEVVRFLRGTDQAILIDERLPHVLRWLNEFSDLWKEETDNA